MIDAKTSNQIYLPLDRMLNQSVANEQAMGSRSGPVVPAPQGAQGQPNQAQQPQAQQQAQGQQQQQQQPQQQNQPQQQVQAAPVTENHPLESVRKIDPRSRDSSRERETR